MSLTEALCLSVTSTGKLGIEMRHRNLLVMERTYIFLIVISTGSLGVSPAIKYSCKHQGTGD